MKLNEIQKAIVETNEPRVAVVAAAASGKALPFKAKVYTEKGPTKIGLLKQGDFIYGEDGKLHEVLGVYPQEKQEKYKIEFNGGNTIYCSGNHLWTYGITNKDTLEFYTQETEILYDRFKRNELSENKKMFLVEKTKPIEFKEKKVPLPPFVAGFLLNHIKDLEEGTLPSFPDSNLRSSAAVPKISSILQDLEIVNHNNFYSFLIKDINKETNFELDILKENLLGSPHKLEKFLKTYVYNTIDVRKEFLFGFLSGKHTILFDEIGIFFFAYKDYNVMKYLQELVCTLGCTATIQANYSQSHLFIKLSEEIYKDFQAQNEFMEDMPIPLYHYNQITDIKPLNEVEDMVCIKIANPTSLFLTDYCIPTHNTECITQRITELLNRGYNPEKIVAITFTNAMADTLKKRIGPRAEKMFVGTIHSYANRLLTANGVTTKEALEKENFDELFQLIKKNPYVTQEVDYLLLDEAQDSNELQLEFIFDYIKPKEFMIVGDFRQSIYSFAGASPEAFLDFTHSDSLKLYYMNKNYRNGEEILDFAKTTIATAGQDYIDYSIAMSLKKGRVIFEPYDPSLLVDMIKRRGQWKDWFVLARSNEQVDVIQDLLSENDIPSDTFKRSQLSAEEFEERMDANTVKVLTIHAAKGLEAPYVIVVGAHMWNLDEIRISYVAITRAKELLIWFTPQPTYKKRKSKFKNMDSWE